jgi:IclR family KDG regulon transcriptional repressor
MSKTLSKALYLLTLFDEKNPLTRLEDLSKKANIPKPTTYRLLKTLEEYGLVRKANFFQNGVSIDTEYYQLGLKCLELGAMVANQFEVRSLSLPFMTKLQHKTQESVQLLIYDRDEAVYIEKVEGTKAVRLYTKIGRRAPLYAGACPRILLSFMPDEEIRKIFKKDLIKITTQTITNKEELWETIHKAREYGYTYSASELEEGTASFGSPIFGRFGEITASLSVAGVETVLTKDRYLDYVEHMWEASAEISKLLGYTKEYPYSLTNITKQIN